MKKLVAGCATFLLLIISVAPKAAGLQRVYTLPCSGTYVIIAIPDFSGESPYTLYAADGSTIIAGPQVSNVFVSINGAIGDHFVIAVTSVFNGSLLSTPITLDGGTSTLQSHIDCVCTLGVPSVCDATPSADSIVGAIYLWTSPSGSTHNLSGYIDMTQPPENGLWTVQATFNAGGCAFTLTNSILFSNCGLLPITYKYVRANSDNCKIKVEWGTGYEGNTDRFEIEMAEEGTADWLKVATIMAGNGRGSQMDYSAEISSNSGSFSKLLRVKEVDADGRFIYSSTVKVKSICNASLNILSVLPNPVHENEALIAKFESGVSRGRSYITIIDLSGRQVLKRLVMVNSSINQYSIPSGNLTKGTYIVRLADDAGRWYSNAVKFNVQ